MKIESKKIDALNQELVLEIASADYAEIERKKISACRKNAEFKGFRKGNVPTSLIQKVYGEQCLVESVNEVISNSLDSYIKDNKLNILGEPLASEKQEAVEWKSGNDFKFTFDIALSPEVKFEVEKSDTVNSYDITASAADKKPMIESLTKYYAEKKDEKSAEDIEKEVTERLENELKQESEWKLSKDIRDYFVKKAGLKIPEEFLKRWLLAANNGKVTKEDVDKEFPGFAEDFKWQLVRGYLMKKYEFKIEDKDIEEAAEAFVKYQYAMYGMGNVPAEMIKEAVKNILSDGKQIERLVEQVEDSKVMAKLKEEITIKPKKITSEKFRAL